MKWSKPTAFHLVLFSLLTFVSCEKTDVMENVLSIQIPMSAAQEVPANTSTATGNISASFNKDTKILTYTVTWSGLTGPVAAMHIHGLAERGVNAGVLQNIITATNGIATPGSRYGTSGSITATLLVDGTVFNESNLRWGRYYLNIHTATYPGGEIRGQLLLP